MEEKRCVLCNKPYDYKYVMFGRGCLENLYGLLKISKPSRFVWNKELYLCTRIAWKNHKFFLSRKKKYALAQKYIALNYLNRMNYNSLDDIKEKIKNDINSISVFSKNIVETVSFTLNDIYKLFNYTQKFDELIKELQNINWEEVDEKVAENFIKSMSFIFDVTKKLDSISYAVFYSMQYTFWQVVVVGGILADMRLSAKLLANSLSLFGKEPSDMLIEDDETIQTILDSKSFKERINQLIKKYGEDKEKFIVDNSAPTEDTLIRFDKNDLLFALHDATMFVKANKDKEDKWNFEIEITDTYDFTDFKDLKEYADADDVIIDIFSTLLNNFGVVSSEYRVIKTYNIKIKFKTKEGEF
ncbi:MAG: hypothetical protein ACI4VQ_07040 [Clostridia bacterium]